MSDEAPFIGNPEKFMQYISRVFIAKSQNPPKALSLDTNGFLLAGWEKLDQFPPFYRAMFLAVCPHKPTGQGFKRVKDDHSPRKRPASKSPETQPATLPAANKAKKAKKDPQPPKSKPPSLPPSQPPRTQGDRQSTRAHKRTSRYTPPSDSEPQQLPNKRLKKSKDYVPSAAEYAAMAPRDQARYAPAVAAQGLSFAPGMNLNQLAASPGQTQRLLQDFAASPNRARSSVRSPLSPVNRHMWDSTEDFDDDLGNLSGLGSDRD